MNIKYLNIINDILSEGIDKGYKSGIKSIVSLNKKNFAEDPVFSIAYTAADEEAIRNFKLEAFTVSGVGSWELEEKLKAVAEKFMRKEIDKDSFELETRKLMMQYGISLGSQAPSGWIETNLDNAVTSSVSAAKWNRMNDPAITKVYPALIYKTQRDKRVRKEHMKLDGLVLKKSDPAWKTIFPPNGWRCRCYTEPLTEEELSKYELIKSSPELRKQWSDEVDPDFRRNSAMSGFIWGKWLTSQLQGMPEAEKNKLKKLVREYGNNL